MTFSGLRVTAQEPASGDFGSEVAALMASTNNVAATNTGTEFQSLLNNGAFSESQENILKEIVKTFKTKKLRKDQLLRIF